MDNVMLTIRMPLDLKQKMEKQAAKEHRSMAQYIVVLVEEDLEKKGAK